MQTLTLKGAYLKKMSDDEFFEFCQSNEELLIQRNNKLELIISTTAGSIVPSLGKVIHKKIKTWTKQGKNGKAFDHATGFLLPDRSVMFPTASWISSERSKSKFAEICPDFVVEIVPDSDSIDHFQTKMQRWISNGCLLGWLIMPESEEVFVYRAGGRVYKVEGFDNVLSGEEVLPGFEFKLVEFRN